MGLRPTRAEVKIQSLPRDQGEVRWGLSSIFTTARSERKRDEQPGLRPGFWQPMQLRVLIGRRESGMTRLHRLQGGWNLGDTFTQGAALGWHASRRWRVSSSASASQSIPFLRCRSTLTSIMVRCARRQGG